MNVSEHMQGAFLSLWHSIRKYCTHECFIQDHFCTDMDLKVTPPEIKHLEEMSSKIDLSKSASLH